MSNLSKQDVNLNSLPTGQMLDNSFASFLFGSSDGQTTTTTTAEGQKCFDEEEYPRPAKRDMWATPSRPNKLSCEAAVTVYAPTMGQIGLSEPRGRYQKQCSRHCMRMSVEAIPNSQKVLDQWMLPFGLVCRPFYNCKKEEDEIPLVDFGNTVGVVRCRQCRTYINPFVTFIDQGRRWSCNACNCANDVPPGYYSPLDAATGNRKDFLDRPELLFGSCEFVANDDFVTRPPQPPVYVFVLDVSASAIYSGFFHASIKIIRDCIQQMAGDDRTLLSFITFDSAVHLYKLKKNSNMPQMMVLPETGNGEVFLPIPDGLLLPLSDQLDQIFILLEKFETMFSREQQPSTCNVGYALQVGQAVMRLYGGKMVCFLSTVPTVGVGMIQGKNNNNNDDDEEKIYKPRTTFYREMGFEFTRNQICCDLFVAANQPMDLPTLHLLSKFTSGSMFFYSAFNLQRDVNRLTNELTHCLLRESGLEAVMRIRTSAGVQIRTFHGNFLINKGCLISLPNIDGDKAFAVELACTEDIIKTSVVYVQCAVLYTHLNGQRRIRVHTLPIPVVGNVVEMYRHADVETTVALLAKIGMERIIQSGQKVAATELDNRCVAALKFYRRYCSSVPQEDTRRLILPESLKLLPLYTLALSKCSAFNPDCSLDEKTMCNVMISSMSVEDILMYIHPWLTRVDNVLSTWVFFFFDVL